MATCTFFGHRDTSDAISDKIKDVLTDLIKNKEVDTFLVGNNGKFDAMVISILKEFSNIYKHIKYFVVLAYMPGKKENVEQPGDCENTLFPYGLENIIPKFAINERNKWMVGQSDYVITYVVKSYGGAAKFKEYAQRKGKTVINLADRE